MQPKKTDELLGILEHTSPGGIEAYLVQEADSLLPEEKPFQRYLRAVLKEHGRKLSEVFLRADFSLRYGYRLVSGEKRTRQRDYILRLCLGGGFTLEETQRALKIYGMSPLYPKMLRDAVLIVGIQNGCCELEEMNRLLARHGQEPLRQGRDGGE